MGKSAYTIRVVYESVDGCREVHTFRTLSGAQRYAHRWVGPHPDMGSHYAVSDDGVGKVTCAGCKLADLFPGA